MKLPDVAERLNVSVPMVRRAIDNGHLRAIRLPAGGKGGKSRVRVSPADLAAYVANARRAAAPVAQVAAVEPVRRGRRAEPAKGGHVFV